MTEHWLGSDVPLHAQHERSAGMGLHICAIVQRGSDHRGEHVETVNDGDAPVPVTGLELTDCSGQQHEHVYWFPPGPGGGAFELAAGHTACVFSGTGRSERTRSGDLILFAGLPAPRLERHIACRAPAAPGWQDHRHDAPRAPPAPPRRPLVKPS